MYDLNNVKFNIACDYSFEGMRITIFQYCVLHLDKNRHESIINANYCNGVLEKITTDSVVTTAIKKSFDTMVKEYFNLNLTGV